MARLLNGCSDQYTIIDLELNQREMMWIKDRFAQIELLANLVLVIYLLVIAGYVIFMMATYCHSYETDAEHEEQGDKLANFLAEAEKQSSVGINWLELKEPVSTRRKQGGDGGYFPSINQVQKTNDAENLVYQDVGIGSRI